MSIDRKFKRLNMIDKRERRCLLRVSESCSLKKEAIRLRRWLSTAYPRMFSVCLDMNCFISYSLLEKSRGYTYCKGSAIWVNSSNHVTVLEYTTSECQSSCHQTEVLVWMIAAAWTSWKITFILLLLSIICII